MAGDLFGGVDKFQCDEHWRDHVLFYEYFHGDNGVGIGAKSEQQTLGHCCGGCYELVSLVSTQIMSNQIPPAGAGGLFRPDLCSVVGRAGWA